MTWWTAESGKLRQCAEWVHCWPCTVRVKQQLIRSWLKNCLTVRISVSWVSICVCECSGWHVLQWMGFYDLHDWVRGFSECVSEWVCEMIQSKCDVTSECVWVNECRELGTVNVSVNECAVSQLPVCERIPWFISVNEYVPVQMSQLPAEWVCERIKRLYEWMSVWQLIQWMCEWMSVWVSDLCERIPCTVRVSNWINVS